LLTGSFFVLAAALIAVRAANTRGQAPAPSAGPALATDAP
jgi:hypothetical protein